MDRYWREIDGQQRRRAGEFPDLRFACPLGDPPAHSRPRPRWQRGPLRYWLYPWQARVASRRPGVRVVHVLDHSFGYLLKAVPARGVFRVATLHDLAPLREGGLTPGQMARFRHSVECLRLADLRLADSRHSADEAAALLDLAPDSIEVLPLGVDTGRFAATAGGGAPAWRTRLAGRPVVLSVGTVIGRKNLAILPDVFRALRTRLPAARPPALLRVGAPLPAELRDALLAVLGADGLVELGPAPDDDLVAAYQGADALIFPSRLEGFGFPVLEAMAAGCPVVCTNVTSLPEVGGDAARYFAPDDPDAAAAGLHTLLTDPAARAAQVEAGRRQAARFSWERHFERLAEIYRRGVAGTP